MTTAQGRLEAAAFAAMPAVFVVLWATGFIGAKLGLPYAEPFTFLALRFVLVALLFLPLALLWRDPWPRGAGQLLHVAVVGVLIHGFYLGGVFAAIARGMPAGLSALIVALQPLLTAALAGPLLGERVTRRQVIGLLLGLLGVGLVLGAKLAPAGTGALFTGFDVWAVVFSLGSLFGMTVAVIYQKRYCGAVNLRTGGVIQYAAATLVVAVPAWLFESNRVVWSGEFVFALGWLILVLSFGAVTLLMLMIRHGEAARVSSLFYLVPPVTALIAHFLFGETLSSPALAGMAVAVVGVALATRPAKN